jgi:membrane protease YdiL (CAAX protease family)
VTLADYFTASTAVRIDQIITAAAATVAVVALIRWFRRGRDPLLDAPDRPNQLREDSILFAVCIYLLAAAGIGQWMTMISKTPEDVRARMFTGSGAQLAGIVVCLALARKSVPGGIRRFMLGEPDTACRPFATALWICLVGIGLCPWVAEATVRTMHYFAPGQPVMPHPTIQALRQGPAPAWISIGLWLGAALIAPVGEELFFRGILQTVLGRVVKSRWTAIVLTSIAFGIVHVSQIHTVVALTLFGALLGYAYERTGAVLVPIAIHALFNLKTLIWEAWGSSIA